MLAAIHAKRKLQLLIGLGLGIVFGFLLQKGGVTNYDVIIGQLLLTDFTVVRIMLSAVLVGTLGVHLLTAMGWARLHPKPGSIGMSVLGGLIFGVGFGLLGYCPGTVAGAVGQGCLDALFGGVVGILLGAWVFAALYPRLEPILTKVDFGELTLPELLKVNRWAVVAAVAVLLVILLVLIDKARL